MEYNNFSQVEKELITAVSQGSLNRVKCVLKNYINIVDEDLVNCHDEVCRTPLQIAASSGYSEICKLLIAIGGDINPGNEAFSSPLLLAASNNHYDTVHMMLEHGAFINCSNAIYAAADEAALKGYKNIENLIKNYLIKNALKYLFKHPELFKDCEFSLLLKDELYNLLIIHNDHPIRLLLHLKVNCVMLQNISKFIHALTLLSEQEFTVPNNERLSWRCHCIGYIFSLTNEYMNTQKRNLEFCNISENNILDSLIKSWLVDQPRNNHSPALLRILDQQIEAYPFKDSIIYQAMTTGIKHFFNEYTLFGTCETCRERSGLKRCANCSNVLYCSQTCQNLHWFVHMTECRNSCLNFPSKIKPSEVQG